MTATKSTPPTAICLFLLGVGALISLGTSAVNNSESPVNPNTQMRNDQSSAYEQPLKVTLKRRLEREGRWHNQAENERNRLMMIARKEMKLAKDDAQDWAYARLNELFPPLPEPEPIEEVASDDEQNDDGEVVGDADSPMDSDGATTDVEPIKGSTRPRGDSDGPAVTGLSEIPEQWPTLSANASLAAEVQWVQANRLRCVKEYGDRVEVDLSKAMTPAPSYSAIGWLETSIRAYTKFVDVAAKATSQLEDEREHVRREKMAIEEVRSLLAEMLDDPK